jgi:hypothetical protein
MLVLNHFRISFYQGYHKSTRLPSFHSVFFRATLRSRTHIISQLLFSLSLSLRITNSKDHILSKSGRDGIVTEICNLELNGSALLYFSPFFFSPSFSFSDERILFCCGVHAPMILNSHAVQHSTASCFIPPLLCKPISTGLKHTKK